MSINRLLKFVSQGVPDVELTSTPVVVSDSKGKYLKCLRTDIDVKQKIVWCCKPGWKSGEVEKWLNNNLRDLCDKHGQIVLYIWVGTCDFTAKEKKFISLLPQPEEVLTSLKENYRRIKALCEDRGLKVVFLHVPYYSIQIWNENKHHTDPECFKADDFKLTSLIDSVNKYIDELNSQSNTASPKFCVDMVRRRKKASSATTRYSVNFGLLRDGIHPSETLARAWMTSIARRICKDCA